MVGSTVQERHRAGLALAAAHANRLPEARDLLTLQRLAGNEAVGTLLQRSGDSAQDARDMVEMRHKLNQRRKLRTAIRRIRRQGTAGNANADQLRLHDGILHAGQHHAFRVVSVSVLIADLTAKIEELSGHSADLHDRVYSRGANPGLRGELRGY